MAEKSVGTESTQRGHVKRHTYNFFDFVREQGVVGLAVGLVLGTAAKTVVDSLVNNIFNPLIGLFTGGVDLGDKGVCLKSAESICQSRLSYGQLISDIISFMTVALVVYLVVHSFKLDKLDKKKEK
jgi:large conductance mechanosensitive channel protein